MRVENTTRPPVAGGRPRRTGQGSLTLPGYPESIFTGDLLLYNLRDGRKLRLATGQANSEVLSVQGGTVIYRVTDILFSVPIGSAALGQPTMLCKSPEALSIHWVFQADR